MDFTRKLVAQVLGAVFVLIGLLGFVNDPVLGLFDVNQAHNLVHLVSGAALLGAVYYKNGQMTKNALVTLGAVYLVVTLAGLLNLFDVNSLLAMNNLDHALHAVLGVVLLGAGLALKK